MMFLHYSEGEHAAVPGRGDDRHVDNGEAPDGGQQQPGVRQVRRGRGLRDDVPLPRGRGGRRRGVR